MIAKKSVYNLIKRSQENKSLTSCFLRKTLTAQLYMASRFQFSRNQKKVQLILHSNDAIEKMHLNKGNKKGHKPQWTTEHEKDESKFKVSLVGLPNCGKSTLFNCLIGEKLAIVDKIPGMTRDRKEFPSLDGLVTFIDTPGVQLNLNERKTEQKLKEDIFMQTIHSLHESSLLLFVIDAKNPISQTEIQFARYLKTFGNKRDIILVCNKCEVDVDEEQLLNEVSRLGFETIFLCSGTQGTGVLQLLNHINDVVPYEMKMKMNQLKEERRKKFQEVIEKIKVQLNQLMEEKGIQVNIREWERDFRKINNDPENNEDLDCENPEKFFVRPEEAFSSTRGAHIKNLKMKNTIKICVIGRPNVGKSSLINEILGNDKILVSQTPHTTRDSISSKIHYKDRKIELIDTAGLNTPNINENQEEYLRKVQISTMLHVQQSHVVVYVMDAFSALQIHDFKLIQSVIKEGRPVIIAINKWEAIKDKYRYKAKNYLKKQISEHLGQLNGHPLVFISAKMGYGLNQMMDKIIMAYDKWNMRISTGLLNNWLDSFKKVDNLPKVGDKVLKINYLIQARVRPPLFVFFVNNKSLFMGHYMRFITRNFAKEFQMDGIPIRTLLRSTNNNENKYKKSKPQKMSSMKFKMQDLKKKYDNFGM